jgi:hypothetical protein
MDAQPLETTDLIERKRFFFEKKNQKIFPVGAQSNDRGTQQMDKSFWFFFSSCGRRVFDTMKDALSYPD